MRVLVTRPLEDGEEIARILSARGHETILSPLLRVRFHDGAALDLGGVQAVLATSANGVRALTRRTQRRDLKIFAVGPQTADAARHANFTDVQSAGGDAAALGELVVHVAKRDGGVLVHAVGAEGESRLAALLGARGFFVRTEFLYDVVAADALSDIAARALKDGAVDAALFFSPRSARVFRQCLTAAGLEGAAMHFIAACISQATATALAPLRFRDIRIAASPNQGALLGLLDAV